MKKQLYLLYFTSELILCSTICVHSATRHNIHMTLISTLGLLSTLNSHKNGASNRMNFRALGFRFRVDENILKAELLENDSVAIIR